MTTKKANYPNLSYVHLYDKEEKGHRRIFVLTLGNKWVTLYCPFTCTGKKMMRHTYDKSLIEEEMVSRRLLKILKSNIKAHGDTTERTKKLVLDITQKLKGRNKREEVL